MTRQLRARPRDTTLTEHDQRLLRYLAAGCTNREIGALVYLSEDTVKTHLRALYAKLGANDRAHAVHLGHLAGVIPCRDQDGGAP